MVVLVRAVLAVLAVSVLAGCAQFMPFLSDGDVASPQSGGDRFPDVLAVELLPVGDRTYDVRVTLSSPYDTPERYADGWRVLDPDGNVLGTHTLLHDHAGEQPFTRTQRAVQIPAGVERVTIEGRDQANGFGGSTLAVEVPNP